MSWSTIAWVVWIVSFVVVEGIALFNDKKDDTLSEHFQRWFSVHTKIGRSVFLVLWVGFAAWFTVHIVTGGWV